MLLLQFSTSHYCRKARLALGYKRIPYRVQNLTPGVHILKLKPLTGLTTVPVLLPELPDQPEAIADSSRIMAFLDRFQPEPSLMPDDSKLQTKALSLEDWFDESIGTATRFIYYQFRANEGKYIDNSLTSQILIQVVRRQLGINGATVALAEARLQIALAKLAQRWPEHDFLIGDRLSRADLAAAALLSPLALIPKYQKEYAWLFEKIAAVHQICGEALPPGLNTH
ncbi:glutathione S-transferase domain-containing protein [Thalassoporum mexicanum PCC 7367]|uniref:glutathione S-transferase family protein n=1 Tax=Thalassoporum mexicanum TaxID=3457544 RepID=UPI00029FF76C|nr:glutathione S-transferase [Pseudanabaena sp. PCC 7367]AFY71086.1 glutathione S-transferase domain-containing protein [Pseudanabaena sp. PCC 7367]